MKHFTVFSPGTRGTLRAMPKSKINKAVAPSFEFKGLSEWFDVFYVGTHTDSQGNTRTYDEEYLHALAENSKPSAEQPHQVPFVVGHPKTDAPAYGWGLDFKVEDGTLYAKGHQVEEAFADLVQDGRYPNRSVKIVETDDGPKLGHVGFLGAAAPALSGLNPVYNAEEGGVEFTFSTSYWYGTSTIARVFRKLREFLIDRYDAETADSVVSGWEIEELSEIAGQQLADDVDDDDGFFTQPKPGKKSTKKEPAMDTNDEKQFSQADVDAAVATAVAEAKDQSNAQYAQERATAERDRFITQVLDTAVEEKRILPAQKDGLRAFMQTLSHDDTEEHTLEFALEDGNKEKVSGLSWFAKTFLEGVAVNPLFTADADLSDTDDGIDVDDGVALGIAAAEYVEEQAAKGITITATQAVAHIQKQQASR